MIGGTLVANVDRLMKNNKIMNVSELCYLSKIERSSLDRLIRDFDNHSLKTLDKLKEFFGCEIKDMFMFLNTDEKIRFTKETEISGLVYFIRSDNGLTKIGMTKDLSNRIKNLKQEHKSEMEVINYIATGDMRTLEKVMHKIFKGKRVTGEWFDLEDNDLDFLKDEK